MHIPSVPGHQRLTNDAASWAQRLNAEMASGENDAATIAAAIMCSGLNIAAAIERAGLQGSIGSRST